MEKSVEADVANVAETLNTLQNHLQCVICFDLLQNPVSTRCGHTFCKLCIDRVVKGKNAVCPLCNTRVYRRGIISNDKIQSLVEAVRTMVSAAQKDGAKLGHENILLLATGPKASTRECFSPPGQTVSKLNTNSKSKSAPKKSSSKVETWLKGVTPTCSTQEPNPSIDADNTPNEDSDSDLVSVSQIKCNKKCAPKQTKALSDHAGDDVSSDQGSQKRGNSRRRASKTVPAKNNVQAKEKFKQDSLSRFLSKSEQSNKTQSISGCSTFAHPTTSVIDVPDPVVVLVDSEKENGDNVLLRSPGWSRVQKMKKDFRQSTKTLKSANHKSLPSPIPLIEDDGSGDDQPCFSLALDSPVLKRKAKIKEIVNNLESEIKMCERASRVEEKSNSGTAKKQNAIALSKRYIGQSSQKQVVQFLKLGSVVARKHHRVPFYLKGALEHLPCLALKSMRFKLHFDAGTQTSPSIDGDLRLILNEPIAPISNCDDKGSHRNLDVSLGRGSARASSEFGVDMDAETVLFSQPLTCQTGELDICQKILPFHDRQEELKMNYIQSQSNSETQDLNKSSQEKENAPKSPCTLQKDSQFQDSSIICSDGSQRSPQRRPQSLRHDPDPSIDLNDSSSSVMQSVKSKRARTLYSSSDSSDSEIGPTNHVKKRKKKKPVLSENEDSCQKLDISLVDTERIMANIEAELEETARNLTPNSLCHDSNKSIALIDQTSNNQNLCPSTRDTLLDASNTQIDSDGDSEFINPTPQKLPATPSRVGTQSEEIVPSSQPPVTGASPSVALLPVPTEKLERNVIVPASSNSNVGSSKSSKKAVFVCSSIPASLISQVEKLASLVGGEFSSKFSSKTTHLIVRVDENNRADKTLKYLSAVASGKWVVSFPWVQKCLEANKIIPEEPFEALDTSGEPGPRRSREAQLSGKKLFAGFEFCCIGDFPDLSKVQLEEILKECGGTVVSGPTDFSFQDRIVPLCLAQWEEDKEPEYCSWLEKYSSPLIQHEWVLDCIGKFAVTSFAPMLLCDVTDDVLASMGIPSYLFEFTETE